ncbi:hypothetical protein AVEN_74016-1 [Araneus ventricosus]|uniref:Uncharacterized protein n=1 Tax=Araneus ventricosus TaxID=182803 RepID=A0A4Y2T8N5_ARAVE|nr:hypothetical protein AVEN_74016-1 [Araneus ventricosus]
MDKWLKTGTLKKSVSRTEIRTTDLAAMEITVDQQDDNHEVQMPIDWPVQECDRYGISDRTATAFASALLQDIGIVHEGEASHVVDLNKISRQREKL